MKKVIVTFDIGKTNKKILLFDEGLNVVYQKEEKFKTTVDEDGDECDDIDLIEHWMKSSLVDLIAGDDYEVKAVNFSTYGASLAFLDAHGKRLTPIYNYLKEIPLDVQENLFKAYGGEAGFCRKTASPALGLMLNSGIQILWLKKYKTEVFKKVKSILHFPQYLSYVLTKKVVSESTSIGCHTFLWDYDTMNYHQWLEDSGIELPAPLANSTCYPVKIGKSVLKVGLGIHDSSSSLAPYIKGSKEKFLLVSTGTWCINMNPFNHSPLTADQLKKDCLSFLSIDQQAVKSSRLFMGHIHDVNVKQLTDHFKVPGDQYKKVKTNDLLVKKHLMSKDRVYFKGGVPANYIDETVDLTQFVDFDEAYHRFMYDLTLVNASSIDLVSTPEDGVKQIYVSGGFARNEIFVRLLASFYPDKKVFTSEVDNSSALGAALVVWDAMMDGDVPNIDLGLKRWHQF